MADDNNSNKRARVDGNAFRLDAGKPRLDLIPANAINDLGRVLSAGQRKYGERNWERGMKWSRVSGPLLRHMNAFMSGEDYDPETGELHIAHVLCNAAFLSEYYRTFPQGDDRNQKVVYQQRRIGLDIDDVLADFIKHYQARHDIQMSPTCWNFDPLLPQRLKELQDDDEFWLSIPVLTPPENIPFEPTCYITSRVCSVEVTNKWLELNGYPLAPVYVANDTRSKADIAEQQKLDIFIDDRYANFQEVSSRGIFCYLFDAPHNQRYNVGFRRIKSLKEIKS